MSRILTPHGTTSAADRSDGGLSGVQIRCPRCQTPYTAPIINVIDVGRYPQLKAALLSGQLNRAQCPSCGAVMVLNVPLVYHDPDKELLLVLIPSELGIPQEQQQRLIGGLVQAIMSSVPPEARKGYFLRPQTILSMQRLLEVVLEADGVTPEMLEAQTARLRLLEEMLHAAADPARLASLIQEHKARLDYAFFVTLTATAQEAEMGGDRESAQRLHALRDQLLQDPELAGRLPQPLPPGTPWQTVVEKLLQLADDEDALSAMIMLNRPIFDYAFFQALTNQLEQARAASDQQQAERLAALRTRLLEEIDRQDQAILAAQQEDLELLEELLNSPDQRTAIRENLARLDTLFLNTLGAAIQDARRQGNIERSARLDSLRQTILSTLAEAMPPELRLVNRLLSLEKPEERRAVLAESSALLNDDLVELIQGLQEDLQDRGQTTTGERLHTILTEVQQARAASGPLQSP